MNLVFMGTPAFAVPSLRRMAADGHRILAVYSQPDKPKNRGMKLVPTPVKAAAEELGLEVRQPASLRSGEELEALRALAPELLVVAAYGKILSPELLAIPALGAINVHSSLLPRYRGAAPINWAILNGDRETGVTIQHMAAALDAGDIITARRTPIGPEEDAAELTERLALLGAEALSEAVAALAAGTASRTPQPAEGEGGYASMLTREMSPVDWTRPAQAIHDQIRGLIPWPCATAVLAGRRLKLFRSRVGEETGCVPGTVLAAGREGIQVACGDGRSLYLTEVQADGGRRMAAADYLRGHPIDL